MRRRSNIGTIGNLVVCLTLVMVSIVGAYACSDKAQVTTPSCGRSMSEFSTYMMLNNFTDEGKALLKDKVTGFAKKLDTILPTLGYTGNPEDDALKISQTIAKQYEKPENPGEMQTPEITEEQKKEEAAVVAVSEMIAMTGYFYGKFTIDREGEKDQEKIRKILQDGISDSLKGFITQIERQVK